MTNQQNKFPVANSDFSISIKPNAVYVRYTPSTSEPRGKLFGFVFNIVMIAALACAVIFVPGKHGRPSMWHEMVHASSVLPVIFGAAGFALLLGLFGWQGTRYARAAWPSDETFHCDHEAITISRVPWLDFRIAPGAQTSTL